MNTIDKLKIYHDLETIKAAPDYMQNIQLLILCKTEPSGRMERIARILAGYGIETEKIVPCMVDLMEEFILNENVTEQNN